MYTYNVNIRANKSISNEQHSVDKESVKLKMMIDYSQSLSAVTNVI